MVDKLGRETWNKTSRSKYKREKRNNNKDKQSDKEEDDPAGTNNIEETRIGNDHHVVEDRRIICQNHIDQKEQRDKE
eukprot:5058016-Heterocapsa_arctica.AAC.1